MILFVVHADMLYNLVIYVTCKKLGKRKMMSKQAQVKVKVKSNVKRKKSENLDFESMTVDRKIVDVYDKEYSYQKNMR